MQMSPAIIVRGLLRVWRHLLVERTHCSDAVVCGFMSPLLRDSRESKINMWLLFPQSRFCSVWTLSSVAGNGWTNQSFCCPLQEKRWGKNKQKVPDMYELLRRGVAVEITGSAMMMLCETWSLLFFPVIAVFRKTRFQINKYFNQVFLMLNSLFVVQ